MIPVAVAGVVAELVRNGLSLLGNAVLAKGRDYIEKETGVKLDAGLSQDQLLQLKQWELQHEEELLRLRHEDDRLELEYYKTEVGDKQSARDREVEMAKVNAGAGQPWWIPSITTALAFVVVIGGGWMLQGSEVDSDIKYFVSSAMTLVLGFFFGTTRGSAKKDDTISTLTDKVQK